MTHLNDPFMWLNVLNESFTTFNHLNDSFSTLNGLNESFRCSVGADEVETVRGWSPRPHRIDVHTAEWLPNVFRR